MIDNWKDYINIPIYIEMYYINILIYDVISDVHSIISVWLKSESQLNHKCISLWSNPYKKWGTKRNSNSCDSKSVTKLSHFLQLVILQKLGLDAHHPRDLKKHKKKHND